MIDYIVANPIKSIFWAWIAVISVISILICFYDKRISKLNHVKLRVPESVLFVVLPFMGGGAAMFLSMMLFRHKTKHWQTYVLIPFFTLLWVAGFFALYHLNIQ